MEIKIEWLYLIYILLTPCLTQTTWSRFVNDDEMQVVIKKLLLKGLGFKSEPRVTMADINKTILGKFNSTNLAKQKQDSKVKLAISAERIGKNKLAFQFNSDLVEKRILSVKLNIEKLTEDQIIIHREKKKGSDLKLIGKLEKPQLGWCTNNITKDVIKWLKKTSDFEYVIQLKGIESNENKAYIDIEYYDEPSSRTKRDKDIQCQKTGGCCRRTIHVSIANYNWDSWFYSPRELDYHYCVGRCTKTQKTVYGQLMSLVTNKTSECCVPTKLQGIRVVHMDENKILYDKEIKDFMADECKCTDSFRI